MRKKIFKVIILILIVLQVATINIFADTTLANIIKSGDEFVKSGKVNDTLENGEEIVQSVSNRVASIFLTVGIIASVIVVAVLGIKFMIGSVEEKAEIKKSLVPFIVGIVIIFGAFTIWSIVVQLLQS